MVLVVFNEVIPDPSTPNRVQVAQKMTKKAILAELLRVSQYPDRVTLALAEDLPAADETEAKDMITMNEYKELRGVSFNNSQKHRMANLVAQKYMEYKGEKPRIIHRPDSRGRFLNKANGFEKSDLWILDECLDLILNPPKDKKGKQ